MDQAIADSSSFIKKMKSKDPQQVAYEKTISDFWDTSEIFTSENSFLSIVRKSK